MSAIERPPVPALALNVKQCCAALNVSFETWRKHVEPDIRVVRVAGAKRVAISELQRWLDENGEAVT